MPDRSVNESNSSVAQCGHAVKAWFKQNGWPQSVPEGWAKAAESEIGPWASQISHLMNGVLQPKPPFFVALGEFNTAVATRDLAAVKERRLLDRLKKGEPMCHDNGEPFDAADFFRLYVGHLAVPDRYALRVELTDTEAAKLCADLMSEFQRLAIKEMNTTRQLWDSLQDYLTEWNPKSIKEFQEVLVGVRVWTGKEATEQQNGAAEHPATVAFQEFEEVCDQVAKTDGYK